MQFPRKLERDFVAIALHWKRADLDKLEIIQCEGGEALEQAAQRSCGLLIPGTVQDQGGWGLEQPGLVNGAATHDRALQPDIL